MSVMKAEGRLAAGLVPLCPLSLGGEGGEGEKHAPPYAKGG